jgi:hypothetical protein
MSPPRLALGRTCPLAFTCIALTLVGCAGLPAAPGCPDLGGTYADQAEASDERLSALLLPQSGSGAARAVTLSLQGQPQQLVVGAGSQRVVLQQGSDFTCEAGELRLALAQQRRINFGSFLTQDVQTIHAFSRAADGALQVVTSTREHSVIYGKAVSGPLRQGAVVRWKPLTTAPTR